MVLPMRAAKPALWEKEVGDLLITTTNYLVMKVDPKW